MLYTVTVEIKVDTSEGTANAVAGLMKSTLIEKFSKKIPGVAETISTRVTEG